jgi:hypothetical protein
MEYEQGSKEPIEPKDYGESSIKFQQFISEYQNGYVKITNGVDYYLMENGVDKYLLALEFF